MRFFPKLVSMQIQDFVAGAYQTCQKHDKHRKVPQAYDTPLIS